MPAENENPSLHRQPRCLADGDDGGNTNGTITNANNILASNSKRPSSFAAELGRRRKPCGVLDDAIPTVSILKYSSKVQKSHEQNSHSYDRQFPPSNGISNEALYDSGFASSATPGSPLILLRTDDHDMRSISEVDDSSPNVSSPYVYERSAGERQNDWEVPFEAISDLQWMGGGAQGVVFLGRLRNEEVAVKKVRELRETEISFLRQLDHPNIIKFKGVCKQPQCYSIIMEYCPYGQLYEVMRDCRGLHPQRIFDWARQIASGLGYLHNNRIIHRDLKSPNILIAQDESIRICDFGTATTFDSSSSTSPSYVGTAAWMAPEMICSAECTQNVDIWSFGVIVWELLTHEVPYRDVDTSAIIYGVGCGDLRLPIPSTFPEGFKYLLSVTWREPPRAPTDTILGILDIARDDFIGMHENSFLALQEKWREEIVHEMAHVKTSGKKVTQFERDLIEKRREELRHARDIREHYERKLERATHLYQELQACMLDMQVRDKEVRRREQVLAKRFGGKNSRFSKRTSGVNLSTLPGPFIPSRSRSALPDVVSHTSSVHQAPSPASALDSASRPPSGRDTSHGPLGTVMVRSNSSRQHLSGTPKRSATSRSPAHLSKPRESGASRSPRAGKSSKSTTNRAPSAPLREKRTERAAGVRSAMELPTPRPDAIRESPESELLLVDNRGKLELKLPHSHVEPSGCKRTAVANVTTVLEAQRSTSNEIPKYVSSTTSVDSGLQSSSSQEKRFDLAEAVSRHSGETLLASVIPAVDATEVNNNSNLPSVPSSTAPSAPLTLHAAVSGDSSHSSQSIIKAPPQSRMPDVRILKAGLNPIAAAAKNDRVVERCLLSEDHLMQQPTSNDTSAFHGCEAGDERARSRLLRKLALGSKGITRSQEHLNRPLSAASVDERGFADTIKSADSSKLIGRLSRKLGIVSKDAVPLLSSSYGPESLGSALKAEWSLLNPPPQTLAGVPPKADSFQVTERRRAAASAHSHQPATRPLNSLPTAAVDHGCERVPTQRRSSITSPAPVRPLTAPASRADTELANFSSGGGSGDRFHNLQRFLDKSPSTEFSHGSDLIVDATRQRLIPFHPIEFEGSEEHVRPASMALVREKSRGADYANDGVAHRSDVDVLPELPRSSSYVCSRFPHTGEPSPHGTAISTEAGLSRKQHPSYDKLFGASMESSIDTNTDSKRSSHNHADVESCCDSPRNSNMLAFASRKSFNLSQHIVTQPRSHVFVDVSSAELLVRRSESIVSPNMDITPKAKTTEQLPSSPSKTLPPVSALADHTLVVCSTKTGQVLSTVPERLSHAVPEPAAPLIMKARSSSDAHSSVPAMPFQERRSLSNVEPSSLNGLAAVSLRNPSAEIESSSSTEPSFSELKRIAHDEDNSLIDIRDHLTSSSQLQGGSHDRLRLQIRSAGPRLEVGTMASPRDLGSAPASDRSGHACYPSERSQRASSDDESERNHLQQHLQAIVDRGTPDPTSESSLASSSASKHSLGLGNQLQLPSNGSSQPADKAKSTARQKVLRKTRGAARSFGRVEDFNGFTSSQLQQEEAPVTTHQGNTEGDCHWVESGDVTVLDLTSEAQTDERTDDENSTQELSRLSVFATDKLEFTSGDQSDSLQVSNRFQKSSSSENLDEIDYRSDDLSDKEDNVQRIKKQVSRRGQVSGHHSLPPLPPDAADLLFSGAGLGLQGLELSELDLVTSSEDSEEEVRAIHRV